MIYINFYVIIITIMNFPKIFFIINVKLTIVVITKDIEFEKVIEPFLLNMQHLFLFLQMQDICKLEFIYLITNK
jgi:hypothetical protein